MWLTNWFRRPTRPRWQDRLCAALEDRNVLLRAQLEHQQIPVPPAPPTWIDPTVPKRFPNPHLPASYRLRRRTERDITVMTRDDLYEDQVRAQGKVLHPDEGVFPNSGPTVASSDAPQKTPT